MMQVYHDLWLQLETIILNKWKWNVKVKVAQSCPILGDPMIYTVHGIL